MPDERDDDYIDIRPWPVADLAGRLISLATLGTRGTVEATVAEDQFAAETDRFDLHAWGVLELGPWLSGEESRVLAIPAGQLDDDDLAACVDALTAAVAIGWALRVVPDERIGIPGTPDATARVLEWCPRPWAAVRRSFANLRVRSDDDLARERERWDVVSWRLSLFGEDDMGSDRAALSEAVAEAAATGLLANDGVDFLTDAGVPLSALGEDDRSDLANLAEIRLRTLNWVCGLGEDWQTTPLVVE